MPTNTAPVMPKIHPHDLVSEDGTSRCYRNLALKSDGGGKVADEKGGVDESIYRLILPGAEGAPPERAIEARDIVFRSQFPHERCAKSPACAENYNFHWASTCDLTRLRLRSSCCARQSPVPRHA